MQKIQIEGAEEIAAERRQHPSQTESKIRSEDGWSIFFFFRQYKKKRRGDAPFSPSALHKSTPVMWNNGKQIVRLYYLRSPLCSSQWNLDQCCRVLGPGYRVHLSLSKQQTMVSVHNEMLRSSFSYLLSAQHQYKLLLQVERTKNPLEPLFLWLWISSSSTAWQGNWMDTQGFWGHRRDLLSRCFGFRPMSSQMNTRGLEKKN